MMTEKRQPTPIEYYGCMNGTEVYIKRDDRIPFSFGGNKVRIAEEVFAEMEARGYGAIVTYGSTTSNLNRVIVHMAAEKKIPCTCIVRKESSDGGHPSFNEIMVLDSSAEIVYTEAEEVRETVAAVLARLAAKGLKPYYIYGDETGKGGEEVLSRAYRKAFEEVCLQEKELGVSFDTIVLPVGTGATLGGLVRACDADHKILGISIARSAETAENKLQEFLVQTGMTEEEAAERITSSCRITDEYLSGGYGKYPKELAEFIRMNLRERGLALDPVYSGKAFFGLMKELEKDTGKDSGKDPEKDTVEESAVNGKCLFIHTGGLPLFFDMLEQI